MPSERPLEPWETSAPAPYLTALRNGHEITFSAVPGGVEVRRDGALVANVAGHGEAEALAEEMISPDPGQAS